jgi:hypothetical protein
MTVMAFAGMPSMLKVIVPLGTSVIVPAEPMAAVPPVGFTPMFALPGLWTRMKLRVLSFDTSDWLDPVRDEIE